MDEDIVDLSALLLLPIIKRRNTLVFDFVPVVDGVGRSGTFLFVVSFGKGDSSSMIVDCSVSCWRFICVRLCCERVFILGERPGLYRVFDSGRTLAGATLFEADPRGADDLPKLASDDAADRL